jgi:hypothetical protein
MWSALYRHHLIGFVGIVSHFPVAFRPQLYKPPDGVARPKRFPAGAPSMKGTEPTLAPSRFPVPSLRNYHSVPLSSLLYISPGTKSRFPRGVFGWQ